MIKWQLINPRRNWLKRRFGDEINAAVNAAIPPAFSADEIYLKYRLKGKHSVNSEFKNDNFFNASHNTDQASKSSSIDTSSNAWIAGEAATIYGTGIFEKFQAVDEHVYEGMSRLANENISSLSDLSQSLGDFKHDFWGDISEKALDKWKGHLAETYAAEHFHQAGQQVDWPETSNQKGWDLLINGHEVNVKLVSDASSLQQHFDKYPDIAVVVPSELDLGSMSDGAYIFDPSNSLDGALSEFLSSADSHKIIVDHALSAAAIKDQALDAADVAIGGTSAVDGQIPWVTVATAGWREMKLLDSGKTDRTTAGKNFSADVVGRGGGAFIGGKAGAAIGTAVTPGPGTLIGGIVGAIVGAIGGGLGSNIYKRRGLVSAIETAKAAENDLRELQAYLDKRSGIQLKEETEQQQYKLVKTREIEQNKIIQAYTKIYNQQKKRFFFTGKQIDSWLSDAQNKLGEIENSTEKKLQTYGIWKRWFWPDTSVIKLEESISALEKISERLDLNKEAVMYNAPIPAYKILQLVSSTGMLRDRIESYYRNTENLRKQNESIYREQINSSYDKIINQRRQCFIDLSAYINKMTASIRESLAPKIKELEMQIDIVKSERAKLGFD